MKKEHIVSYNVRRICKIRDISFKELAQYVAIEPKVLYKTLTTNPDYKTMKKIATVLGYPLTELVREKDNAPIQAFVMTESGCFIARDANTLTSTMRDYRRWRRKGLLPKQEDWTCELNDTDIPEDFYQIDSAKQ